MGDDHDKQHAHNTRCEKKRVGGTTEDEPYTQEHDREADHATHSTFSIHVARPRYAQERTGDKACIPVCCAFWWWWSPFRRPRRTTWRLPGTSWTSSPRTTGRGHSTLTSPSRRRSVPRGLMFRETMAEDEGMLFLFGREAPRSFWMKNTYLPLDIIFLDRHGVIVSIAADARPLDETSIPSGPAGGRGPRGARRHLPAAGSRTRRPRDSPRFRPLSGRDDGATCWHHNTGLDRLVAECPEGEV